MSGIPGAGEAVRCFFASDVSGEVSRTLERSSTIDTIWSIADLLLGGHSIELGGVLVGGHSVEVGGVIGPHALAVGGLFDLWRHLCGCLAVGGELGLGGGVGTLRCIFGGFGWLCGGLCGGGGGMGLLGFQAGTAGRVIGLAGSDEVGNRNEVSGTAGRATGLGLGGDGCFVLALAAA